MKTSLIAILAAVVPVHAHAADQDVRGDASSEPAIASTPNDSTQKGNDQLPEIVVTAQMRQQSLKDVPISVAVVSGETLADYNIRDLSQARQFIPNLEYENGGEGAAIIMRGFGNNGGTNFGFDSPVGTFVDGVYHGRLNQTRLAFLDVGRIEVLRGPQGTLFGMNTVAGAISLVSNKPTDVFEGSLNAEYDPRFQSFQLTGVASGPISDTLSVRVAAIGAAQRGYLYNTNLDRHENGSDDLAGRIMLRWRPTSNLTTTVKLEAGTREQTGINRQALTPPSSPAQLAAMQAIDPDVSFSPRDLKTGVGPAARDLESLEGVLTNDLDVGPFTVTSITAYSKFKEESNIGISSAPISLGQIRASEDFKQFSQELRMVSNGNNTIDYLAGLYFQSSTMDHVRSLDFILKNYVPTFAGTPAGEMQTYAGDFSQKYKTYAAFGQVTWNAAPRLHLTGGVRYAIERKSGNSFFDWLRPGMSGAENALVPGTPEFDVSNFVFNGLFRIVRHTDSGRYRRESFLPEGKVLWDVSDEVSLYAAYGRGEKAGGFNDRDNRAINFTFGPEKSTNYEVGAKTRLFGGTAQFDIALFRTEFRDMQISVFDISQLVFIVDNAASAVTQGIEAEGRLRVSRSLTINGSIGWLERARFEKFLVQCIPSPSDPSCVTGPDGSFRDSGKQDLNAPKLTASIGFDYTRPIGSDLELSVRADAHYRGRSEDLINRVGAVTPVTFVNARLGIAQRDKGWSLAIVGANITDRRHNMTRATSLFPGMFTGEVSPPRTIAIQAGVSF